jgi:hypothetical protein
MLCSNSFLLRYSVSPQYLSSPLDCPVDKSSLHWSFLTYSTCLPFVTLVTGLQWVWVWVICYDRRSVDQSVLEQKTHLGLKTKFLLLSDSCRFVNVGALSDEMTDLSFTIAAGPRQHSHSSSESRGTRYNILLSQIRNFLPNKVKVTLRLTVSQSVSLDLQSTSNPPKVILRVPTREHLVEPFSFLVVMQNVFRCCDSRGSRSCCPAMGAVVTQPPHNPLPRNCWLLTSNGYLSQ